MQSLLGGNVASQRQLLHVAPLQHTVPRSGRNTSLRRVWCDTARLSITHLATNSNTGPRSRNSSPQVWKLTRYRSRNHVGACKSLLPATSVVREPHESRITSSTALFPDTRTQRMVNPNAWERGMVLAQCSRCGIWHKLQDNGGMPVRANTNVTTPVIAPGLIDEVIYIEGSTTDEDMEAPARTDEGL